MSRVRYEYAPEALEILAGHGLQPGPNTPPAVVREALSDLYRYEIRRLKQRLLAGDIPKEAYSSHVIELRRQYWLLSIPVQRWTRELTDSQTRPSSSPNHEITKSRDPEIP